MISLTDFSVFALALVFSVYAIFSAFIFGLSLELMFPKISATNKAPGKLLKSIWELSDILLAIGLCGFIILFGNSLDYIRTDIRPLVLVLAVGVAARALLVIKICRTKKPHLISIGMKKLLLLSSFAVGASLGSLAVYFLLGEQFWQSLNGWLLFTGSLLGLAAVGLTLVNAKKWMTQIISGLWLLTLCCVWPLYQEIQGSHNLDYWFGLWLSFVIVIVSLMIVTDGMAKKNYLRVGIPVIGLITPVLLASANNPDLVYGAVSVNDAFSVPGSETATWLLLSLAVIAAVYGLWFLAKSLVPKKLF